MTNKARVNKLEKAVKPATPAGPGYVSLSPGQYEQYQSGALQLAAPVKIYIGISPNDWDQPSQNSPQESPGGPESKKA